MAQVQVKLTDDELVQLDDWALAHDISRTAAGRELFLKGLNGTEQANGAVVEEKPKVNAKDDGVYFLFKETYKYFGQGCRFKGYIFGGNNVAINYGGTFDIYNLKELPVEVQYE